MKKTELKDIDNLYRCPECGYEKCFSKYEIGWSPLLDAQRLDRPRTLECERCGELMKPIDET